MNRRLLFYDGLDFVDESVSDGSYYVWGQDVDRFWLIVLNE